MGRKSKIQKEQEILQDRIACLDHWINTPWIYTDDILKAEYTLGRLIVQYSKCADDIKKNLKIRHIKKSIVDKAIELRKTIKSADEFWKSEAYLMGSPNYEWKDVPDFVHKDMISDAMFLGYIVEKFGEEKALKIKILLNI